MTVIEVRGLHKAYGGRKVVDGVSFEVGEGEVFGILGPNGAGKTTTVECVEGLRTPDAGLVRVCGYDPAVQRAELTRVLGVQLQESELQARLTVREALDLYASFYPVPVDRHSLAERLGLLPHLGTRFQQLSGGQKQRLFIALALIGGPRVVVLDELTTGLDPRARREVWELVESIRDDGVTVLLVTHFMEEAQRLCDRIALLDGGRIAALDTPGGLIGRATAAKAISFAADTPLDPETLRALPGAVSVETADGRTVLSGTDETVSAFVTLLARRGVTAGQLRVADASLDDAYLDLTETNPR
ncbi:MULTISPECIES: ABC transporter ATP-binding protein [unclassified Streptomyces]|uniref:ABC transporter ATP-binding protein n=1 Tax=unclassified Streptomyces TaxID=2593676 RepID=UPI0016614977|nr:MULTISPECIES: ABC transporter ATP-binding protein [unclassified Streptomyces]MBD0710659.1 multidrug ABC transporter ATP-binding protein [Streptomyces sp. CBMA291]MBD0715506.1 multidrug ABC transporter ATP-binding protein [Streptomyces sp. CBMA370]